MQYAMQPPRKGVMESEWTQTSDARRALAVVEDGQLAEGLARTHASQDGVLLQDLHLALRQHVQVASWAQAHWSLRPLHARTEKSKPIRVKKYVLEHILRPIQKAISLLPDHLVWVSK